MKENVRMRTGKSQTYAVFLKKSEKKRKKKRRRKSTPRALMENKIINGLPKIRKTKTYLYT